MKKQERFKIFYPEGKKPYKFDRYIFKACVYTMFIYLFIIACIVGFDTQRKLYINCKGTTECINPLIDNLQYLKYCNGDWCNETYLQPGFSYGEPPTTLNNSFLIFVIFIFLVGFVLNHYKYNRGG